MICRWREKTCGSDCERTDMFRCLKTLFGVRTAVPELPVILDSAEFERLIPTIGSFPRPEWEKIKTRIESEYKDRQELLLL